MAKTVVDMTQRERRAIQTTRFLALRTYDETQVSELTETAVMLLCAQAAEGDEAALHKCIDYVDRCEKLLGICF